MPRLCKNCGTPNESIYDHYCAPCRPGMKAAAIKRSNQRTIQRQRNERKTLRLSNIADTYVQSDTAKRLAVETPEDIKAQAYQELRYFAKGLGAAPEEGNANQAAYRRMMGRMGAIGGIA